MDYNPSDDSGPNYQIRCSDLGFSTDYSIMVFKEITPLNLMMVGRSTDPLLIQNIGLSP